MVVVSGIITLLSQIHATNDVLCRRGRGLGEGPSCGLSMATSSRTLNSALLQDVGISVGSVNGANKKGSASFASVTFVLLNTALGSGILGLPGAFAKAGFIGGSVLLTLVAITSVVGVHLLVEVADRTGRPATFFTVAQAAAGAKAGILIDMLICMNAFGVSTSYLIVIGDAMPEVAGSFHGIPSALKERTVWILIGLAIGAPLAFLRNLSALRFTAYIAFVGVMYICVLVGLYAIAPLTSLKHELEPCANMTAPCHGDVVMLGEPLAALDSLPVFIFAFTCHQNAISITNEMVMPTPRRVAGAAASATALALGLYLIVGIGGYYTYGDLVKSDILVMYPDGSVMPVIGRLAIAFVVTTCYPMQLHPGRASLISLLHTFGAPDKQGSHPPPLSPLSAHT